MNYVLIIATPIIPIITTTMISHMSEMTRPAIAKPLGLLNIAIPDNINPTNHINQPITGTQLNKKAQSATMKPAIPNPFVGLLGLVT